MVKTWLILTLVSSMLFFIPSESSHVDEDRSVALVLEELGDEPLSHKADLTVPGASAIRGKELVLYGITSDPKGGRTNKQSNHFVCTSCHNVVKDEPDLAHPDAEARLQYAKENHLPYLQGTALYGAINRTRFYNGDYFKKYGDLVAKARDDLREAIQLCAVECSQGRPLKPWEMESIVAYLWSIDLKLKDLSLSSSELEIVENALQKNSNQQNAIDILKSKYLDHSPATFINPPENRKEGYGLEGDIHSGKLIYDLSCKHCHFQERYSFFNLSDSQLDFQFLKKHTPKYTRYSIYQIIRYGTPPMHGKKAYMPQYTKERLSNQQVEDLRAYIEFLATGNDMIEEPEIGK